METQTISKSFSEAKNSTEDLYHLLPRNYCHNEDVEEIVGKTIRVGHSTSDRDSVAAQLFSLCLMVEDRLRSEKLAQKFVWNDNVVIPIGCGNTKSQASFGVDPQAWSLLSSIDSNNTLAIGDAVQTVITALIDAGVANTRISF